MNDLQARQIVEVIRKFFLEICEQYAILKKSVAVREDYSFDGKFIEGTLTYRIKLEVKNPCVRRVRVENKVD